MDEKTIRPLVERFCHAAGIPEHVDVFVEAIRELHVIGKWIRARRYANDEKAAWTLLAIASSSSGLTEAVYMADAVVVERRKRYPPPETEAKAEVSGGN